MTQQPDDPSVDSYRFLPQSFRADFEAFPEQPGLFLRAQPTRPLAEARVALLSTAGIYLKDSQPAFDLDRERREPLWGDPTYRLIPSDVRQDQIGVSHLHVNGDDIRADINVALPLPLFRQLADERAFGSLADVHYSFMGYQGASTDAWRDRYGPELARRLADDAVNLLILAPA